MFETLFLPIVILSLGLVLCLPFLIRRELNRHISNLDHFSLLMPRCTIKKGHLSVNRKVEGTYRGRRVWCTVFYPGRYTPYILNPDQHGIFKTGLISRCPVHLCMEPLPAKDNNYPQSWTELRRKKTVTASTGLYPDGRVYFDSMATDTPQKGLRVVLPALDPQHDRKNLWALLGLEMRPDDVRFFLDELSRAAEKIEQEDISDRQGD